MKARNWTVTAAGGALVALCASPLTAQPMCAERAAIIDMLGTRYGETLRSVGLVGGNRIVEVLASDETGSWTILVTNAEGLACLIASGQHYQVVSAAPGGEPL